MTDSMILELLGKLNQSVTFPNTILGHDETGRAIRIGDIYGLNLSNSSITALPENIGSLQYLRELNVNNTKITALPKSIGYLRNLRKLDAGNTQITVLPKEIGDLYNLELLDVSNSNLIKLTENIGNLRMLDSLDVSNTQLSTLPDSIGNLGKLRMLHLHHTNITALPDSIGKLTSLLVLQISHTKLNSLSNGIENLTNVSRLDISNTEITALPKIIGNLNSLHKLDVSNTKLVTIPEEIGNLSNLERLNLSGIKKIIELPESIRNLRNLKYLDLSETEIKDINVLSEAISLESLNLQKSKTKLLPESLIDHFLNIFTEEYESQYINNHSGLFIHGLTLTDQPIEIFNQSKELIRSYYRAGDKVPVNECKVIFLGDAESGKTHSIRRLLKNGEYLDEFDGESTPGIEITVSPTKLANTNIVVNYWDFGGQEIQHSMHRMFLTERTVYVVFLNARQDDLMDERARYWLENIKAFAPEAPVLVVINKIDQNDQPRFNEKGFIKAYGKQVKKIIRLSAKKDEKQVFLGKLQGNINSIILELPTVSKKIPRSWKTLMENIRGMEDHYLTTEQFIEKCRLNRIMDYKEIHDELVDLFQVIGVSFCYYKDRSIADYMLLNPKWMLNALYTIVVNGKASAQNGVIIQNDLYDLLEKEKINGITIRRVIPELRYKSYEVNYIMGVIRMFGLSYSMKGGSEFLPMLCDGDEKKSVADIPKDALHFIFRYQYLPTNIVHRLIVDMQEDIDYQYVWYTGAVFRNESQNQFAYVHSLENELHIYVYGEKDYYSLNEYLTPILNKIRYINKKLGIFAEELLTYRINDIETEIPFDEVMGNLRNKTYSRYDSKTKSMIDYREISQRYIDDRPKIDHILQSIIKALEALQSNKTYYRDENNSRDLENSRNHFVAIYLDAAGYNCSEQLPGGLSENEMAAGERDIVIKDIMGQEILIYEGMNITSLDKTYINKHINKLLRNYNSKGLRKGVLVTYLECKRDKYLSVINGYRKHISDYAPEEFKCVGEPIDFPSYGQYLTVLGMSYEVGGLYYLIYHIVVRVAK